MSEKYMSEMLNEMQSGKHMDDAPEKRHRMGRTNEDKNKKSRLHKDVLSRDYVHLYKPDPTDWYGETKQYLYRVRDGWRRGNLLKKKCRAIDGEQPAGATGNTGDRGDRGDTLCADEFHKKLKKGEQDMKNVTAEVMDLLDILPDVRQQTVMKMRYLKGRTWKEIATKMKLSESEVLAYYQKALPILKRKLKSIGAIC